MSMKTTMPASTPLISAPAVEGFVSFSGNLYFTPDPNGGTLWHSDGPFSSERLQQVLAITSEIFSGTISNIVSVDPAEPQFPFMVFRIEQSMPHVEFREKMNRWYDGVVPIWPQDPTVYRLMVDPSL